jgi:cytoskeletal protein CcmA (bactofilin family)
MTTHIGMSVVVTGELSSDEDLRFDGTLKGDLDVDATLTLGETAAVEANIQARQVIVHGTVRGSIAAADRIELTATATVNGNLTAEQVVIAEGASFNGGVYMGRRTIARRVAHYKAGMAP